MFKMLKLEVVMVKVFLKFMFVAFIWLFANAVYSQGDYVQSKLGDFDQYMEKVLKEWNCPGAGVGIVYKNKMMFVKGYGYKDFDKKAPVTANTLFQIASNTKLFTAIAAGILVDEGKLEWDKPIKKFVPTIQFYNDELNNSVSLRDMLSHRTGVSRHDMIWYKSDLSRKDLFDNLKYMEPSQPVRTGFLYNNMMYASVGYSIELLTQKTWETFVKDKLFVPLSMISTNFSINDMKKKPDYFVPYNEKRDSDVLYKIPYYEETQGMGPAGSIISNMNDLSHWLIALMNDGKYDGKQAIPPDVLKATLSPSMAINNSQFENKGYTEILNPVYGLGRQSVSYRGHYLTYHGGDLDGIHSQISCMTQDSVGVIVFVIGDQSSPLQNVISYNIYDRLLGLSQIPWNERYLKDKTAGKLASKQARSKAGDSKVPNTKPSHSMNDYVGQFEHPAYGIIKITSKGEALQFDFHKIILPLNHYHFDRFDTPDDEENGLFSVNFITNPQGDVDKILMAVDEGEVTFVRKPDQSLSDAKKLAQYTGKYEYAGQFYVVDIKNENQLYVKMSGQPDMILIPYKANVFKSESSSDTLIEFVVEGGKAKIMKYKVPSGEYELIKK
jgi:CubicO group peptidase (beta-lactamase class C family)